MHNIEISPEGIAAFAATRVPAWHALGTVADHDLTVAEAMDLAHLAGWNVRTEPVMIPVGEGTDLRFLPFPGRVATVRDNPYVPGQVDALGIVTDAYTVAQVEEVAEFAQTIADEGLVVDAAGSLDNGRRYFFTFRLPEALKVGGVDEVDTYFAVWSSHDGSLATSGQVTPIRVVCANTLSATIASDATWRFSFRHIGDGLEGKVAEAREALGLTFAAVDAFAAEAEEWLARDVTAVEFDRIVEGLFPLADDAAALTRTVTGERRDMFRSIAESSPTLVDVRGTAWGTLNAATEMQEWFMGPVDAEAAARRRLDSPVMTQGRARATAVVRRVLAI